MATRRNWFKTIRRKLLRSSNRNIVVVYTNTSPSTHDESVSYQGLDAIASSSSSFQEKYLTEEDIAAIRLQAFFRGHLARQAFRALRSLVKLQALVRGVHVRKQSRIALHCMHAMVRLQVKVRARQLLNGTVPAEPSQFNLLSLNMSNKCL